MARGEEAREVKASDVEGITKRRQEGKASHIISLALSPHSLSSADLCLQSRERNSWLLTQAFWVGATQYQVIIEAGIEKTAAFPFFSCFFCLRTLLSVGSSPTFLLKQKPDYLEDLRTLNQPPVLSEKEDASGDDKQDTKQVPLPRIVPSAPYPSA